MFGNLSARIADLLIIAAAVISLYTPQKAWSAEEQAAGHHLSLSYRFALLGIPFGELDYGATFQRTRYDAEFRFRTNGFAAVLWKSKIDTSAQGHIASDGALLPTLYTSRSETRSGKVQTVHVSFAGVGTPIMTADPPYDLSRYPVTDAEKMGTVDPVTALSSIVAGLNTTAAQPCGRRLSIFDGRRRYDLVFSAVPEEHPTVHDLNMQLRICKAQYRHIAGIKQEVVDVSVVPTIYAQFIDIPSGGGRYTVAQAMWSSFLWGAVSARLTDVRLDGRQLVLPP